MKKTAKLIICLTLLAGPGAASEGPWAAGLGRLSCKEVAGYVKEAAYAEMLVDEWIRGFMSGQNIGRYQQGATGLTDLDPLHDFHRSPWQAIKPECDAHPDYSVVAAWLAVVEAQHLGTLKTDPFTPSSPKKITQ